MGRRSEAHRRQARLSRAFSHGARRTRGPARRAARFRGARHPARQHRSDARAGLARADARRFGTFGRPLRCDRSVHGRMARNSQVHLEPRDPVRRRRRVHRVAIVGERPLASRAARPPLLVAHGLRRRAHAALSRRYPVSVRRDRLRAASFRSSRSARHPRAVGNDARRLYRTRARVHGIVRGKRSGRRCRDHLRIRDRCAARGNRRGCTRTARSPTS